MSQVQLCEPRRADEAEFLAAVDSSRQLHQPWVWPPDSRQEFRSYVQRAQSARAICFLLRTAAGELGGVINASEIVRAGFQSAYLGYYAFRPHEGTGLMREGMQRVLTELFKHRGLHRLEANIQPANLRSRGLVERLGFRLEGFSPAYLKVGGQWCDHERWAILADEWG